MRKITAYMKVYLEIKKKIMDGIYKPGMLLPTESELEKIHGVSRITVRKAVAMLSEEGYVKVVQGKGTEIRDISTMQRLNQVTSITETLRQEGYEVTVKGMNIEEVIPPSMVTEALERKPGETVYCIHRILCADGKPIAIMKNYLVKDWIPEFEKHVDEFVGLYKFLEETYGIVLIEASEKLTAQNADYLESQVLEVPMGTALLCSCRVGRIVQGPFEYAVNKLVGERYVFSVHLNGMRQ